MFYRSRDVDRRAAAPAARAAPSIALAGVAFVVGAIVGANHVAPRCTASPARSPPPGPPATTRRCTREIDAASRARCRSATSRTSTRRRERPRRRPLRVSGKPHDAAGGVVVGAGCRAHAAVRHAARAISDCRSAAADGRPRTWSRSLAFPGLRAGERLERQHDAAAARHAAGARRLGAGARSGARSRTALLAARATVASAVLGSIGPIPAEPADGARSRGSAERRDRRRQRAGARARRSAARHARRRAAGRPAACSRESRRAPAPAVRTTISPRCSGRRSARSAASSAASSRWSPASGEILAVAGIGLDGAAAAGLDLQDGHADRRAAGRLGAARRPCSPTRRTPRSTACSCDNANGEDCGGTLALAFAVSCNSVFAPLGVKLGAARLVATAERFGFNQAPGIPGARREHATAGAEIQGELDGRLDRDRPGRGAGDAAADGDRRRDDRRRRDAVRSRRSLAERPARPRIPVTSAASRPRPCGA